MSIIKIIKNNDCEKIKLVEIKKLLDKKYPVNEKIIYDETALMAASERGYINIVKLLLEYNADPNIQCDCKRTALSFAIIHNHLKIVKILLKHGSNIDQHDEVNLTPLDYACRGGQLDIVKYLVKYPEYNITKRNFLHYPGVRMHIKKYRNILLCIIENGGDISRSFSYHFVAPYKLEIMKSLNIRYSLLRQCVTFIRKNMSKFSKNSLLNLIKDLRDFFIIF